MASKAIVAIFTIFALGIFAQSASGMVLPKQASATVSASASAPAANSSATALSVTLTLQLASINGSAAFQNALEQLKNNSETIKNEIADALNKVNLTAPVDQVKQFLSNLASNIQNSSLTQAAKQALNQTISTLKTDVAKGQDQLNSIASQALQQLQTLKNLTDNAADSLKTSIESGLKNLTSIAQAGGADISAVVQKLNASLHSGDLDAILKNVTAQLLNGTQTLTLSNILSQFNSSQVGPNLVGNLTQALGKLDGKFQDAIKQVLNGTTQLGAGAVNTIGSVVNGLGGLLGNATGVLGGALNGTLSALSPALGTLNGALNQTVGGLVGGLNSAVTGVATGAGQAVGGIVGGVSTVAGGILGGIGNVVGGLTGGILKPTRPSFFG